MRARRDRTRVRRGATDGGAVLVELALVLPILMLLISGIIDFGFALSDQIALRQGVREGARYGVVADVSSAPCSGNQRAKLICLTKARTDIDVEDLSVFVKLDASSSGTPEAGQSITVCAAAPVVSVTGFLSPMLDDKKLTAQVTMRVEAASTISAGGDVDPTGRNWTWCQ